MNKKTIIAAVIAAALLCGCSEGAENQGPAETTAAANNYTAQETDTTVTGEVTAITGNEVTLALGTISNDGAAREKNFDGEMSGGENLPEDGSKPEMPADGSMPDMPEGEDMPEFDGNMPEGEMPDMENMPEMPEGGGESGGRGERGGQNGGGRRGSASVEKTGEEASYIIPVGMTIDGMSGRTVDYSGITVGMVLTLTVNEDGVVCAAKVE